MIDWENLFENWPKAVFIIDRDGEFILKNKSMSETCSDSGDNFLNLLDKPPDTVHSFIKDPDYDGPNPLRTTVKIMNGPLYELTLSNRPQSDKITGELRLLKAEDDRQVRRLEEVIQEIRQLGHDMCQPLTVILGQSEIMQMIHSQDEEINRRLNAIISEAEKLEEMTRKLSLLIQYRHQD